MAIIREIKSYEIIIKKKTETQADGFKEVLAEQRHYTDEEIDKNYHYLRAAEGREKYMKKIHITVPSINTERTEIEILKLNIDSISLPTIVNAILSGNKQEEFPKS